MKKKKFPLLRIALRILSFIIAGMMVSIAMLSNMDTYSWFTDEEKSSLSVSAATADDILSSIDSGYEADGTPYITLQKADGLSFIPIIYFSVVGKAAAYLKPVNPVRLESNSPVKVLLEPTVSLTQFVHLVKNGPNEMQGILKIKYLNEFIDKPISFRLSRQYLIDAFLSGIVSNPSGQPLDKIICDLITYIAPMTTWAPASPDSKGRIRLTPGQEEIVNIIVPELIAYLNRLCSDNLNLYDQLSQKERKIEEKDEELKKITIESNALKKKIEELSELIDKQSAISKSLMDKTKLLEATPSPESGSSPAPQGTPVQTASPEATD